VCGIFGFALKRTVPMAMVFRVLEKLEVHQYPYEPNPIGGYGAGVAILKDKGCVALEKIGRVDASPAGHLSKIVKISEASFLVGHVRMPSPKFMENASFKETAQPYVAKCYSGLTVISAHNGNVTNYKEIREKLSEPHVFESEKVELIDSEVIPHLFEKLLREKGMVDDALDALFSAIEGPNAVTLLRTGKEGTSLHFVHKGKTRGLTIWTNDHNEIIFCSRKEPLMREFGEIIARRKFEEKVVIPYHEDALLKLSFPVAFR